MAHRFSGRSLRRLRTQRRLTREALAVGAGVSVSALIRYEQDRAVPGLNAAAALAEALDVQIGHLLHPDGEGIR
jgi:transcriptional regulator with XRE-family HTH domain